MDAAVWNQIKTSLSKRNENNKLIETWFDPIQFMGSQDTENGKKISLGVPSDLHKYWISENLLDRICTEIRESYKGKFTIDLIVDKSLERNHRNTNNLEEAMVQNIRRTTQAPGENNVPTTNNKSDVLNKDYTFRTFVVGKNNEFAHAASYNVSQNPGTNGYNPLFICGPVGMGKTHLLHSVGNQIMESFPHFRIRYVSAERFLNDFISSIRRNQMEKFRERYRERSDVLLVDDVQVLGRGDSVQEEFFHTLNHFFEKSRQVVVASDRMPKDIAGLEDRICSRLEWGLIADIKMPDFETRVAILRYKAERLGLKLTESVVEYIARISKRSIRELEGNLKKVKMFSELQGLNVDMQLTKEVLATHDTPSSITLEDIQRLVADQFGVKISELKTKTRAKPVVVPRQIAMYLIKKHLDKSLMDIGRAFGGRDHTTVINALRKVEQLQAQDTEIKRNIEELTNRIHNITGL